MNTNFQNMSDQALNSYLKTLYHDEALQFNLEVNELFSLPALRQWFRSGFPAQVTGMSSGMIRLAATTLIEKTSLFKRMKLS